MELYFAPDILREKFLLSTKESYHCVKVLRHKEGDVINVIDGAGGLYEAEITSAHKEHCSFKILHEKKEFGKRGFHLHIAIAPTKNIERLEWFLEKATEIGIDEITPIICEHSERRKANRERLENILVSAMKQSVKAYLPKLNELCSYKDFINKQINSSAQKFICQLHENNKIHLKSIYQRGENALVLVGPEGDFTSAEISMALENNFLPVILGASRLRTETAGLVASHTINLINE